MISIEIKHDNYLRQIHAHGLMHYANLLSSTLRILVSESVELP